MLRIKEIAKEKGIALNDLANMLGITYQALNARITGNPSLKVLIELANVLDVDVRELITPTKEKTTTATPLYIKNEVGDFVECGALYLQPQCTSPESLQE
ncbi:helix-turn-helix transcriptional regulator [Capnocytophaga sp. Marseille-Q4570]|jgi:DNA-binding helix-turn-helix protein|uniref:Helix-turn-helix transcriptional regulator n=1 Tax=Capnocytophaga bilenii TaxID=2819369 RepID=A0ABS3PZV0_9FLAO|nr:helix-turn-helix transcriptional regulator [Capnocytophaga bilenii]MBO1884864.1 helix-turn-helix transcriptional regulator [Capnocytophaga bilenii]